MTNAQIIATVAAEHKLPVDTILHTFAMWKKLGFSVKKGEHGIETRLWKYNPKFAQKQAADEQEDEEDTKLRKSGFYLAKAYLFTQAQVEVIKQEADK